MLCLFSKQIGFWKRTKRSKVWRLILQNSVQFNIFKQYLRIFTDSLICETCHISERAECLLLHTIFATRHSGLGSPWPGYKSTVKWLRKLVLLMCVTWGHMSSSSGTSSPSKSFTHASPTAFTETKASLLAGVACTQLAFRHYRWNLTMQNELNAFKGKWNKSAKMKNEERMVITCKPSLWIDHFRVPFSLSFKASLSAKFLSW